MIALDASALLAFMFRERGHQRVAALLTDCCMSTVNEAEVLARFVRDGHDEALVADRLRHTPIEWVDFTGAHARRAAGLIRHTAALGLSLGDRACLALALERGVPAVTADATWAKLALEVAIEVIR
jgi:PIN domain nuclease of toxin-antitoxin system